MPRTRRTSTIVSMLVIAVVFGAGIFFRLREVRGTDTESASAVIEAVAPGASSALSGDIAIPVEGERAHRGVLVISVNASGQAEAWRRMIVTPLVEGRISELRVRENMGVAAGDPVVVLDPVEADDHGASGVHDHRPQGFRLHG